MKYFRRFSPFFYVAIAVAASLFIGVVPAIFNIHDSIVVAGLGMSSFFGLMASMVFLGYVIHLVFSDKRGDDDL